MRFIGKLKRGRRGVGSIIGATFIALILLSGFTFYTVILSIIEHYNATTNSMSEWDWNRNREGTRIKTVKITGSNNLNVTVENAGPISSHLIWIGIFNKSATPESQVYSALNENLEPAETKSIVSSLTVLKGKKYVIQLTTELGNKIECKFYPASQVKCALTLVASPPTVYQGNNMTMLLTVSNNDTEVDTIQSLTVILGANQPSLVEVKETPSSLTVESLGKGQSAFFRWVYNAKNMGTVIFNATYGQAPADAYALSSVAILASPGQGGQGVITISGKNCTTSYTPSQWSLVGSTQYVSGSISDLANNDSSHMVFRSYGSGVGVNINDFVDSNSSNVDGFPNKGTHSNFTAMQYGPDLIYDTLKEGASSGSTTAYYPSNYNLLGSTQYVSGNLANLQANDGVYMTFRGYQTAYSGQALYAHSETTVIGGTSYYLQKLVSADGTATSLSASMASTGRQLLGKFAYPLTGVTSIPASAWTMYYRAWRDSVPAIAFDAASSVETVASASSVSWSHTTGTGLNRLLLVAIGVHDASGNQPTTVQSVTYGGIPLTQVTTALYSSQDPQVRAYIFRLVNPASAANTITVTFAASTLYACGAATYSGVDQTTPLQASNTATGSDTSQSVSVTVTGSGRAVFGHLSGHRTANPTAWTITEGVGQNNRWSGETYLYKGRGSDKLNVAAGSVSMGWTTSRTIRWVCSAVVINPADAAGHADIDVLIRKSDGSIRGTVATNVAASVNLTAVVTTLTGAFSWSAYTVADQTDYLEIDYYVDVASAATGVNVYLRIDDFTLLIADQTRATNVMLPSECTVELEFLGNANTDSWFQLVWTIDSSFTVDGVTATFQLYNFTAGAYSTSGNGYITDTIGSTDITKTQTITTNPAHFRDASGNWRIKVRGVKATSTQFDWRGDLAKCEPSSNNYELDLEVQWTGVNSTQANEWLCIYGGSMGSENIRVDVWFGSTWNNLFTDLSSGWNNMSVSSYLVASTFTISFRDGTIAGDNAQDSWNVDVSLLHLWALGSGYMSEVEFTGSSNLQTWTQLTWLTDCAWDIGQVTVTIQFFNFTLGNYVSTGNGYLSYVSSPTSNTDESKSQTIASNLDNFRNSTGYWRVKIGGFKLTAIQFQMKADWISFQTAYSSSGTTIPQNTWQWYTIKATDSEGTPLPYAYVSIYANGTSIVFRNATDKASVSNPAWVHLNNFGEFYLELKSTYSSSQVFILYTIVGSIVGQKTITQEAP